MKRNYLPYLILLGSLFLGACKKGSNEVIIDPKLTSASSPMQITIDKVINDSTIVLKWNKFNGKGFINYTLYRYGNALVNGRINYTTTLLKTFTSVDSLQYTETKMPFSRDIFYAVNVTTDSIKNNASAAVTYQRPNTYYQLALYDVLINTQKKYLYTYDASGHIMLLDYTNNRQIASTDLKANIGFCALGDYQGTMNELYVPTSDGWLNILDASTLALKDRIYVTGGAVTSVVASNGQLFVSSNDESLSISGYDNQLKVYNRQTKAVIARSGYTNNTRLLYLQGSGTELIDVTLNQTPIEQHYFKFNAAGVLQTKITDPYFSVYNYDFNNYRSFPDGSKFITGTSGLIFNKNLVYDRTIKANSSFSDFTFNTDGSVIYAASSSTNTSLQSSIQAISYPALSLLKTYPTLLNPFKIFRDGNSIIIISTSGYYHPSFYAYPGTVYFMIEKINL